MTNVSVPEANMLKSSSTLAVSVPINLTIKLGSVSVNCLRETYFVDTLRNSSKLSRIYQYHDITNIYPTFSYSRCMNNHGGEESLGFPDL